MPVPIDRSMPAGDDDERRAERQDPGHGRRHQDADEVARVKKYGLAIEKKMRITTRLAKASNCWAEPPKRARTAVRGGDGSTVGVGVGVTVEVTSSPFLRR
jgi:hypothetical protein